MTRSFRVVPQILAPPTGGRFSPYQLLRLVAGADAFAASSLRTRSRSRSRLISMAYFRADHHHIVASGGACGNAEMYHSASRSPAFARAQYLRESFLITLTLRLQPGD